MKLCTMEQYEMCLYALGITDSEIFVTDGGCLVIIIRQWVWWWNRKKIYYTIMSNTLVGNHVKIYFGKELVCTS